MDTLILSNTITILLNYEFLLKINLLCDTFYKKLSFLQLDYFGVASVAHTLLHGNYMKLTKKGDVFVPNGSLKR